MNNKGRRRTVKRYCKSDAALNDRGMFGAAPVQSRAVVSVSVECDDE